VIVATASTSSAGGTKCVASTYHTMPRPSAVMADRSEAVLALPARESAFLK
jgi:hypothetical protein